MNTFLIIKYLHFVGIFGVVGSLFAETVMIKSQMTRRELRRLAGVDGIYGLSAVVTLTMGMMLWLGVGKPAEFYSTNWIFHTKLFSFVLVGILSVWPTVFFLKSRKGEEMELVEIPKRMILLIKVELVLVFLIPLFATLMANGVGSF